MAFCILFKLNRSIIVHVQTTPFCRRKYFIALFIHLHTSCSQLVSVISANFLHFIRTDDKPSLLDLLNFPGKHRKFNVIQEIKLKYSDFGTCLLNDAGGSRVSSLERKRHFDSNTIS